MSDLHEIVKIKGTFRSSRKKYQTQRNINLKEHKHVIYHFKARDLEMMNFKESFMNFSKFIITHIFPIL